MPAFFANIPSLEAFLCIKDWIQSRYFPDINTFFSTKSVYAAFLFYNTIQIFFFVFTPVCRCSIVRQF